MATTSASWEMVDLEKLQQHDSLEMRKLHEVSKKTGLFYLNLGNCSLSRQLLNLLPTVYALSEQYFDQPKEKKLEDVREQAPSLDRGYKSSNCDETFEMADDELLAGAIELPPLFSADVELLRTFSKLSNEICKTMLYCLENNLPGNGETALGGAHRDDQASESGLKLIYEPSLAHLAEVGDNKHTDSGTFTFLFYDQMGLHVKEPQQDAWNFVPPMADCAVVNVANSLERLSGGVYHSPLHRVTQPTDGFAKRYYVSYFLRPENKVKDSWSS